MSGPTRANAVGPDQLQAYLADRIVDGREARALVRAYPKADSLAEAISALGIDEAAPLAARIKELASASPYAFVDVGGHDGQPDLSHEFMAVAHSQGTADPLPGATWDAEAHLTSWHGFTDFARQLKAQLDERRQSDPQAHLTLVLNVHGNNGTGMKLSSARDVATDHGTRREIQESIASVAWIDQALHAAGLTPADITIVDEACNAGRAYATTVDGLNADDRQQIRTQSRILSDSAGREWLYVNGDRTRGLRPGRTEQDSYRILPPELLDAAAPNREAQYTWVGIVKGVNTSVTSMYRLAGEHTISMQREDEEGHLGAVTGDATIGVLNQVPRGIGVQGDVVTADDPMMAQLRERILTNGAGFYHATERQAGR